MVPGRVQSLAHLFRVRPDILSALAIDDLLEALHLEPRDTRTVKTRGELTGGPYT